VFAKFYRQRKSHISQPYYGDCLFCFSHFYIRCLFES
jgi:hypothetical protein